MMGEGEEERKRERQRKEKKNWKTDIEETLGGLIKNMIEIFIFVIVFYI